MPPTVDIPSPLQPYAAGRSRVDLADGCATVAGALGELARLHPGVVDRVTDERGELRRHVNLFVDGENVRYMDGLRTPLASDSTLTIVPAVSGG